MLISSSPNSHCKEDEDFGDMLAECSGGEEGGGGRGWG